MAERKSGPVKPPVIELKAREAEKPAAVSTARGKAAEAASEAAAEAIPEPVEEQVRPAPPPPPRPQARLAMPWSAISIATVAGGLLGAGLVYGLSTWLPLPDQRPVIADPAARLDATDSSLGEIETRLAAIEEQSKRTQVSLDATIAQLDGGLNEVRQSIAAVPAAAEPVDLTPLQAELKSLEDRVTAIGAGASSADATALAGTISTIEAGIAELRTQLTALDQRVAATDGSIAGLKGEVASTQTAISAQNQTLGGTDIGPAVRLPLVVSGLESAIGNGRPFTAELAGLKALLPDLVVPGAIEAAAAEGLPRPDAVVARFTTEVPSVLAGRAAVSTGDMGEDALEWMKGLLALRPVGEVPGDAPEAIVSRLEAAVGRHDFKAAAELLAQLPPAMQAGAGTAGADITKLATAEDFMTELRSRALAPTAEATPVIRLAYWLIVSLLVTAGIAWLIGLPGTLTIEFLDFRMQPRLGVAAFLAVAGVVLIILIWGIVKRIVAAPYYIARQSRERRKDAGYMALSDGFIALQAGDANRARQLAREARGNLPRNAAAQLLEARADLALGDMHSAREHYRALITNRKTALAALSGLYDQARQQGRPDAALTFAQKAIDISPQAPWAREAVFDDLTRSGRWDDAYRMIADEQAVTREEKTRKRRRQAVVEAARAQLAEGTDPHAALEHALSALKLQPDFVPAALIAARIYSNRGEARRAMSLLRRVWRATSHPDIATLFANSVPGVSAVDRLKRVGELIDTPPPNKASALVLARASIDAFDWVGARQALAGYSNANPSQAVCLLMAEIEDGQSGDKGKARDWLNRAVRAPRDPVWTADGITAEEWEPLSPVTGKLDAFEWRVPTSAVATRTGSTPTLPESAPPPTPAEPEKPQGGPLALPGA